MENELINGYKLLTDKIAENYGVGNRLLLQAEADHIRLLKSFNKELRTNSLLWLHTMINLEPDALQSLVDQVNTINKQLRLQFSLHCQINKVIIQPFNTIGLN